MTRAIISAALLSILVASPATARAQTAADLFQQALRKEQVDGDLKTAIALYERILSEHRSDRALAAKALLQIGGAYERLGNASARTVYERVTRDYKDQSEQASVAEVRLSALSAVGAPQSGREPTLKRLWQDAPGGVGGTTPDGRYLVFVDGETGRLGLRDLRMAENRYLTENPDHPYESYALTGIPSFDGQLVAYTWYTKKQPVELRVVEVRSGATHTVYANPGTDFIVPMAWSADGKRLLVFAVGKDRVVQIAFVSTDESRFTPVKSWGWRGPPERMSLSPDGKFIAYSFPPGEGSDQRDIFVLASDGSSESVLVSGVADDRVLGWSRDGRYVLYKSTRSGQTSFWLAPVVNGRRAGDAILATNVSGNIQPGGFTASGAFIYTVVNPPRLGAYIGALERDGRARTALVPAMADRSEAWATQVSHDGLSLAYATSRVDSRDGMQLMVRARSGGQEREIPSEVQYATATRWSPDDRYLMVTGQDKRGRRGIFRVEPMTGVTKLAIPSLIAAEQVFAGWSSDGRSLIYTGIDPLDRRTYGAFVQQDVATGEERQIARIGEGRVSSPKSSPNGKEVAFIWSDSLVPGSLALRRLTLEDGRVHDVLRPTGGSSIGAYTWSSDGRYVYHVLVTEQGKATTRQLMRVSVESGETFDTGLSLPGPVLAIQLRPDSEQIIVTMEDSGVTRRDVWMVENILPKLAKP